MVLAGITAAAGLAGSIFGGIKNANEKKAAQRTLDNMQKDNEDLFNREYYQDYTKRSDVQNLLGTLRERFKDQNDAARNTAAVMGATPESVVAQQKETNRAYGDAFGQIAANADAHKDNVLNRYMNQKSILNNQQIANYRNQAQQWNNFMNNGANLLKGSIGSLGNDVLNDNKKETTL